jgi:mannosyl-oligosaccharide alpha-1,2-mannosidase
MSLKKLLVAALALSGALDASARNIQAPFLRVPTAYKQDLANVRDIFSTSYGAYRKYAYGHDDLAPLTKVCLRDWYML